MAEQASQKEQLIKWVSQTLAKQVQPKGVKPKMQLPKPQKSAQLDNRLQQLRAQLKKQLKLHHSHIREEQARVGKLADELEEVRTNCERVLQQQQILKRQVEKMASEGPGDEIEKKFGQQIQSSFNSIQEIIKNYINDQSVIVLKIKNIEEKLAEANANKQSMTFQLTPRDASPHKSSFGYMKAKPVKSPPQPKLSTHSSTTDKYKPPITSIRPIQRQSSSKAIGAHSERQRSYSSKKITDLRQKLKQFELINSKYQRCEQNEQKQGQTPNPKNVIEQLKQYKLMLEHTNSQMDISNTFNQEMVQIMRKPQNKYKKVDKVFNKT